MKNWILIIDSLNGILSDSIANKEIAYTCNDASKIMQGDRLLGYISAPIGEIRMLLTATKGGNGTTLFLEKIFEISSGCKVNEDLYDQVLATSSTENKCIEIPEESFNDMAHNIFERVNMQKQAFLNGITFNADEQKENFKKWLSSQRKSNGELYSENTIYSYIHQMESAYEYFNKYKEYESVFQIQDPDELKEYVDYLYAEEGFEDFNLKAGNKACSCGFEKYKEFIGVNFQDGLKNYDILNHNLFGIHMTSKNNALSKDNPHICIGWSKMGDLSDCTDKDSISEKHAKTWPEAKPKSRWQDVGQIYRFVLESQIGDYVVYGDGSIAHIGVIKSDYYYQENPQEQDPDYVNNKSVEWLKDVPYTELSKEFKHSLGSAMSFFRLNDYKSVITELLEGTYIKDDSDEDADSEENLTAPIQNRTKGGINRIYYGAPGCGKSRYVSNIIKDAGVKKDNVIRVTFHPEYANCDFIGQILPTVETIKSADGTSKDIVKYIFNPGPLTLALKTAYNTGDMVYLIIEEINRGNAAAIFGDMFQLLDRVRDIESENYSASEYPVCNPNMQKWLLGEVFDDVIKQTLKEGVFVPSNLTIFATMNSSDQNVFTLDTAFKRRWSFEQISNKFTDDDKKQRGLFVPGTDVTWELFLTKLNDKILENKIHNQTNEDKRLGKYFVTKDCLTETVKNIADVQDIASAFAYKVLEYVWNDVCKIGREDWFDIETNKTLEDLIDAFLHPSEGKTSLSVFQNLIF